MDHLPDTALRELEAVTREYARYSHSAGGLSSVIGGVLALMSFGIGAMSAPTGISRFVLISLPFIWLLARHLFALHYQNIGLVTENIDPKLQRVQHLMAAGVLLLWIINVIGAVLNFGNSSLAVAMSAALLLIPLMAVGSLRTPIELVIATLLICQAALAANGRSFAALSAATLLLPVALLMISHGWRDHRRFLALRQKMQVIIATQGHLQPRNLD